MADMIAFIRENSRRTVRGMSFDDRIGRLVCQILEGETIKPKLNMEHWLGDGVTISNATASNDGGTVSLSTATPEITLTVSAVDSMCDTDLTITASDGRVRIEKFRFVTPNCSGRSDYGTRIGA